MLGSFATYGEGKGCCNSGKRNNDNADQQSIIETTSGNLVFSDSSDKKEKKQEDVVREKIVNRYIYRDRPVEKIVTKDRIVKEEIPLTGTINFSNGKKIWNADLLKNYVDLVKEVTGAYYNDENFYSSDAKIEVVYKNHKNEFNPNINFDKVREYLNGIRMAELDIYKKFNELFPNESDQTNNENVVKNFMIRINNIIYHILLSTYEKTLMELFNYYEVKDEASSGLEKKRNICTCVNVRNRINSIYTEWSNLKFFSDVKGAFFNECAAVVNMNEVLFKFYKKKDKMENRLLNLDVLSAELKINNNINIPTRIDEYGNQTKSLIYKIRYATMQILTDFVIGVNAKLLEKFPFLSNGFSNLSDLKLKIYYNSSFKDMFLVNDQKSREDKNMYTLIDKIIVEDFNILKRIYDDLCYVDGNIFGSCYNNTVALTGKNDNDMYDISSLLKLYNTVCLSNGELCAYIKDNIFSLQVIGFNDITKKGKVTKPLNTLLNTKIAKGSFITLNNNVYNITKIGNVIYDDRIQ